MALVVLPEDPIRWRGGEWTLRRADSVQKFITGARQVTSYSEANWAGTIELPALDGPAAGLWKAALMKLSSLGNTFEATPPDYQDGPSTGYAGAAPRVDGAGQLGLALRVDGLPADAEILAPGDYFHVTAEGVKELKMITEPVVSDSVGDATLMFQPALRNAPLNNATVEIFKPKTAFALVNPRAAWGLQLGGFHTVTLDVEEAFGP